MFIDASQVNKTIPYSAYFDSVWAASRISFLYVYVDNYICVFTVIFVFKQFKSFQVHTRPWLRSIYIYIYIYIYMHIYIYVHTYICSSSKLHLKHVAEVLFKATTLSLVDIYQQCHIFFWGGCSIIQSERLRLIYSLRYIASCFKYKDSGKPFKKKNSSHWWLNDATDDMCYYKKDVQVNDGSPMLQTSCVITTRISKSPAARQCFRHDVLLQQGSPSPQRPVNATDTMGYSTRISNSLMAHQCYKHHVPFQPGSLSHKWPPPIP